MPARRFILPIATPLTEGSLDIALEIRRAMTKAIERSGLSRYQVAARMSELLGADITKAKLDAFTAPSRGRWRMPLEYAPAFDAATGTNCLLELFARKRDASVLVGKEAIDAELGRLDRQMADLHEQRAMLLTAASIEEHLS